MRIRKAKPSDAPEIYRVLLSTEETMPWLDADECREHVERMIGLGVTPIVAELDDCVVGELEAWWGEDVPEIGYSLDVSMINVHRDYQRRGIGSALMHHAFRMAEEKRCERVSVWAAPEAIGFYRKLGFEDRLLLRKLVTATATLEEMPRIEFRPVKLADLDMPSGANLQTARVLHPRQRWHDFACEEAKPRRWKDTQERRPSIFTYVAKIPGASEPAVAVYRLCYWLGDASKAELYLWSPIKDASVLASSIAHASTLRIRTLSVLAYGEVAGCLAALGGEARAEEKVLVREIKAA